METNTTPRLEKLDVEFALLIAEKAVEIAMKKIHKKEPLYKLSNPALVEAFPDLNREILKQWAVAGKIGKKGKQGMYWVTISEIEKYLTSNK